MLSSKEHIAYVAQFERYIVTGLLFPGSFTRVSKNAQGQDREEDSSGWCCFYYTRASAKAQKKQGEFCDIVVKGWKTMCETHRGAHKDQLYKIAYDAEQKA
eukprot:TRINITY_DN1531_c0_g1_i11.p4 TRINITY_DN1531_c0_g1~~TRINITY_DN1531_c0_g1_i11.p4  ORF type:complete len:101 (+),score=13.94 TRINITY_DN1531_c0_g1_i11:619-921(+)